MRINDWSADVCSSDLVQIAAAADLVEAAALEVRVANETFDAGQRLQECEEGARIEGIEHVTAEAVAQIVRAVATLQELRIVHLHNAGHLQRREIGEKPLDHRSEEHTYELQSLMRNSYAVFCLKKKHKINHTHHTTINTQ